MKYKHFGHSPNKQSEQNVINLLLIFGNRGVQKPCQKPFAKEHSHPEEACFINACDVYFCSVNKMYYGM